MKNKEGAENNDKRVDAQKTNDEVLKN